MDDRIVAHIPLFVTQQGERVKSTRSRFIYNPAAPEYVTIACDQFALWVSRDGLYAGQQRCHVEACGDITIWPHAAGQFVWTVLDIDTGSLPGAQVQASNLLIADFLDRAYAAVPAGLEGDFRVLADDDTFDAELGAWLAGAL